MPRPFRLLLACAVCIASGHLPAAPAPNPDPSGSTLTPWGNLVSVRVHGRLLEFEAGPCVVEPGWSAIQPAMKYLQRPAYQRDTNRQTVRSRIDQTAFRTTLEDLSPGNSLLGVHVTQEQTTPSEGVFTVFDFPEQLTSAGTLTLLDVTSSGNAPTPSIPASPTSRRLRLEDPGLATGGELDRAVARGFRLESATAHLEIRTDPPIEFVVRRDLADPPTRRNDPNLRRRLLPPARQPAGIQLYCRLLPPNAPDGATGSASFHITASPLGETLPARIRIDASQPGRRFDGIGGNFRLQFPETDPAVIAYNLDHLPLAWSRVALPWPEWDPEESTPPLAAARAGRLHPQVDATLRLTRDLAQRGLPVMVSVWTPPSWSRAPQPAGLRGWAVDPAHTQRTARSLVEYLVFLRERHGVEPALFSVNEPETGVDYRQTPAEHAAFLQEMGTRIASSNLTTRLILGDTAHATAKALAFLQPALDDPAVRPHLGAIAFHTWRGCTPDTLADWSAAARPLGLPLLVTEAGPDAHLHEYPPVMLEPWFALDEIDLYLRACSGAQAGAILHWQLTTDYSVLQGGGQLGDKGPLRPTQRFWNLRQLAQTPSGAFHLPIQLEPQAELTGAAFLHRGASGISIHVVNRGARREATLEGLPASVRTLRAFRTDATSAMEPHPEPVQVRDGTATVEFPAASYLTWVGESGYP